MANSNGINRTGNDILFDCEADILSNSPDHKSNVYNFIRDWKETKGVEHNNNFSHDNWTGVYCWVKKFQPDLMKRLPLFGHHAWRPDNFAFYLHAKLPIIRWPLLPIIFLSCVFSSMQVWRKNNNRPGKHITTSGKLLAYFQCKAFNLRFTKSVMDYFIHRHKEFQSWFTVFDIYFKDDHRVFKAFMLNAPRYETANPKGDRNG